MRRQLRNHRHNQPQQPPAELAAELTAEPPAIEAQPEPIQEQPTEIVDVQPQVVEDPAVASWNEAEASVREGQFERAFDAYQKFIELRPTNRAAHFNLGICLQKLEMYEEAVEALEHALAIDPGFGQARIALAWLQSRLRNWDRALPNFEEYLKNAPDDKAAEQGFAQALEASSRPEEAERAYRRMLEADPENATVLTNLMVLAAAKPDLPSLRKHAEALLAIRPESPQALAGLITADLSEQHYEAAFDRGTQFVSIKPDSFQGWFNLGLAAQQTGRAVEAEQAYRRAIEIEDSHADAFGNLGCILYDRGDLAGAQELFEKQHKLSTDQGSALWNLGLVHERLGDWKNAENCFGRLVETDPSRPEPLFHLGYVRFEEQDWGGARKALESCLSLKRNWVEARVYLGLSQLTGGDPDSAKLNFQEALSEDPLCIPALQCLATLALASNDVKAAPELEAQIADLEATSPEFCYNLGVVQGRAKQYAAASQSYRRAVAKKPMFSEALLNLGTVLDEQGQRTKPFKTGGQHSN